VSRPSKQHLSHILVCPEREDTMKEKIEMERTTAKLSLISLGV